MIGIQTQETNPDSWSSRNTLLLAVCLAVLVHVVLLVGFNFNRPPAPKISRSIDITLAHGVLMPKSVEPPMPMTVIEQPNPVKEQVSASGETAAAPVKVAPVKKAATAVKKPAPVKVAGQPLPPAKSKPPIAEQTSVAVEPVAERPKLSAEALQQQIAQLGERIRSSQQSPESAKIKFVNAISSHKFLASQYKKDWEDKVERTGNLNYPEAARNQSEPQTLVMDVGINADGSIYSMRITKSSGNQALDEAAMRIVKMSAPFAELPYELQKEVNVLVITIPWKFSDQTGMTAR